MATGSARTSDPLQAGPCSDGYRDGGDRIRVLLVDDDPSALHDLEAKVRSADVEVVGTTNDGEHALELARLLRPDLALIDWNMRRFGGALTARLMRRYAPDVCPVLLIEHADLEEVQTKDAEITFCTVMKHSDGTDLSDALRAARRHAATRERPN